MKKSKAKKHGKKPLFAPHQSQAPHEPGTSGVCTAEEEHMIPEVPPLLHERLEAQYGAELAREIEAGYVRKRTTFRVNPLKGDREAVLREIADAGIAVEPIAWYDDAFLLPDGNEEQLRALPCYGAGAIYLQSLSRCCQRWCLRRKQAKPCWTWRLPPAAKRRRWRRCPGGKALITACEKNAIRADRLQFNLTRQGARAVNIMRAGRAPAGQPVQVRQDSAGRTLFRKRHAAA